MIKKNYSKILFIFSVAFILLGCAQPLPWPDSPLYEIPATDPDWNPPQDIDGVKQSLVGHYAHYDIIAYEDETTKTPMKTFIISYGFTDFFLEDGKLFQKDSFIHAEQKINQARINSYFRDEAVQAIKPRIQEVELTLVDGIWHMYRPPTPTLLGITGDPLLPLSRDPEDPRLVDPDEDGNPGVTVDISISKIINGEIYITRREIFTNYLTLHSNGTLYGYVKDESEQFVIGASLKMLAQPSASIQNPDFGLSPIMLIPISEDIDTAEELMEIRDQLFPPEPDFPGKE
jgi:hypothetical protein